MDARIRNQQAREATRPLRFEPVNWQPQVEVTFTRDVNGWLSQDENVKWHFGAGTTHIIDEQHAIEFIVKGYATGRLPRHVSENERAALRSVITVIGMGDAIQTRNGGPD